LGSGKKYYFLSAASLNPTVLYEPLLDLPSPLNIAEQERDVAYQEPPRITFTFLPFSAPFFASTILEVQSQELPDTSKHPKSLLPSGYLSTADVLPPSSEILPNTSVYTKPL